MDAELCSILQKLTFPAECEALREQCDRLLEADSSELRSILSSLEEELKSPATRLVQHCGYRYLFAGAIALHERYPDRARAWLEQAICSFRRQGDSYHEALAAWMLMLACLQARQFDAVRFDSAYQAAGQALRQWASLAGLENSALHREIEAGIGKSYASAAAVRPPAAAGVPPPEPTMADFLSIGSFPLLQGVRAGPNGEFYVENAPQEIILDISRFQIGQEVYAVFSAHSGERRVSIHRDRRYAWARVEGNSMNAAKPVPILEGDLALFYQTDGVADENAIVIASRPDDRDPSAYRYMVKRWRGGRLISESTETVPDIAVDDRHGVLGVVVAIARRERS